MPIKQIAEITGLSEVEIENLKWTMKKIDYDEVKNHSRFFCIIEITTQID